MFFSKVKSKNINDKSIVFNSFVIDVRSKEDFKKGKIRGCKNIEINTLLAHPELYLNKNDEYYIMCLSGMRSKKVVKVLSKQGYNLVNLDGGYMNYLG